MKTHNADINASINSVSINYNATIKKSCFKKVKTSSKKGRPSKWNYQPTTVIRVPEKYASEILEYARLLFLSEQ